MILEILIKSKQDKSHLLEIKNSNLSFHLEAK